MIIHVGAGTNDYATKCPTEKIFNNFCDISVLIKCLSRTGIVNSSSITPCVDNPVAATSDVKVKDGISECTFVCYQDNFLCWNGMSMKNCSRSMAFTCLNYPPTGLSRTWSCYRKVDIAIRLFSDCEIKNMLKPSCPPQHHIISVVPNDQVATLNDRSPGRWRPPPSPKQRTQAPGTTQPHKHQDK